MSIETTSIAFDSVTKGLPTKAIEWLQTWKPDRDMRMHMKGGSPIWPYCIPDVFAENGFVTEGHRLGLAKRIITDAIERVGYAEVGTPEFKELLSLDPMFNFQRPDGTWKIAVQEITLDHLVWAFKQGHVQAGHVAAIMFMSYFNNKAWSYLRDGGNADKPYMARGRARTARGCLAVCRGMLEILKAGGITSGPAWQFVKNLLNEHVARIHKHLPLVDDPAGDHLSVPFHSSYQVATLGTEIAKCRAAEFVTSLVMARDIEDVAQATVEFSKKTSTTGYYDVAIVDGKPAYHPEMEKQITTLNGVLSWCVPMMDGWFLQDWHQSLLIEAGNLRWPTEQPASMAQFFGRLS